MTAILRAPELSATSRIDRIWIMGFSCQSGAAWRLDRLRLLHNARHDPPLAGRQRPGWHHGHLVAHAGVLLVVRHEPRGQPELLAVEALAHLALDGDDHALGHLVADDPADNL